eukprot:TRINITY_DN7681_c1_g6_i1.p1 TRINITY_DN7681_c1_g6~~TRINITY_DN7681_c1_g6_i1.p1  ORF type:complete len:112 (-),score=28.10 TRINITY_DN7681_c1_g6_i1:40-375(-)
MGDKSQRLYQIISGSCYARIKLEEQYVKVFPLETREVFGELSFILDYAGTASAQHFDVVAESEVEVYIIEGFFINILFQMYTGFASRFFKHIAKILHQRITTLSKQSKNRK